MSAKKLIDQVKAKGGEVKGFESYTGGLVAPESDDNPWNYKFHMESKKCCFGWSRWELQNL
jgi:hypothetical protein